MGNYRGVKFKEATHRLILTVEIMQTFDLLKFALALTCDQASFLFRGRKVRLIQLPDYSSAAP